MAKRRTIHRCQTCGATSPQWVGRCPGCEAWGTLVEELDPAVERATAGGPLALPGPADRPLPIAEVDPNEVTPRSTGVGELDRVLGGGLVAGSVTLIAGEPGIGKSTLLTQAAAATARNGDRVLYVSAEESRHQVRRRAERLGAVVDGLWLAAETFLPHVVSSIDSLGPALVIVDSIQALEDPDLASAPGSVAQVRACAHQLVREAKARGIAVVLVGHVTKDGGIAGPRVLEHAVDTVLSFEGDRHHALRMVRASKHRFGPTGELGLFEMADGGLVGLPEAGALFLADRRPGLPGSAVVPALEGSRPILVEVQALVATSRINQPRRSAEGVDHGRLAVVLAVLEQRAGLDVSADDVFAIAAGGVQVTEPAADLGIALAVASSFTGVPLPADLVVCGEVGLGGELRQVAQTNRRLAEAARLGFGNALVPRSAPEAPPGIRTLRATTLYEALQALDLTARRARVA